MVEITSLPRNRRFITNPEDAPADITPVSTRGLLERIALGTAGFTTNLIDDVVSSVGITEPDTINEEISQIAPDVGQFIRTNKPALEAGSGIALAVASALPQGRIARLLGRGVSSLGAGTRVGAALQRLAKAEEVSFAAARQVSRELATAGAGALGFSAAKVFPVASGTFAKAATKVRGNAALRGAGEALLGEATLFTIANENAFLFATAEQAAEEEPLFDSPVLTDAAFAGLGVGLGATIRAIQAGRRLRLLFAEEDVMRAHFDAIDPTGFTRLLEGGAETGGAAGRIDAPNGTVTDAITAQAVMRAAELDAARTPGGPALANVEPTATERLRAIFGSSTKREKSQVPSEIAAPGLLNRVTKRGLPGIPNTGFTVSRSRANQNLQRALERDPTILSGVEYIAQFEGQHPASLVERFKTNAKELVQSLLATPVDKRPPDFEKLLKRAQFDSQLEFGVIRKGEFVPLDDFDRFDVADLEPFEARIFQDRVTDEVDVFSEKVFGFEVDNAGNVGFPKKVTFGTLTPRQAQALYAVGDRVINNVLNTQGRVFEVPNNPSHFVIDLAEEILRRSGNDTTKVRLPVGVTMDALRLESFAQKVDLFKEFRELFGKETFIEREIFNFPRPLASDLGESAVDFILDAVENGDVIRRSTIQEVRKIIADAHNARQTLLEITPDNVSLVGDSFTAGLSDIGRPLEDVLVARRPAAARLFTRENLIERLSDAQADIRARLKETQGTTVAKLAAEVDASANTRFAVSSASLIDLQATASLATRSQAKQRVISTTRIGEDNPVIKAAQAVNNLARRTFDSVPTETIQQIPAGATRTVERALKEIRLNVNAGKRALVEQFITARRAFDLSGEIARIPDTDKVAFRLAKTPRNEERYRLLFNTSMPKDAVLVDPTTRKTVVVDADLGLDVIRGLDHLGARFLAEQNAILKAAGLPEITRVPFHVPPRDLTNQQVAFVFSPSGELVSTFSAPTKEQLERGLAKLRSDPKSIVNRPGHVVRRREDIERFNSIFERAQTQFADPNLPSTQFGNLDGKRGGGAAPLVEIGAIDVAVRQIERNFSRLARDFIEVRFQNQIAGARRRSAAIGGKDRNIHDVFLDTILGVRKSESSKAGTITRGNNFIENVSNLMLRNASVVTGELAQVLPFGNSRAATRDYKRMVEQVGRENLFFKDALDFIEQQRLAKIPLTTRELAPKLNRIMAALILRYDGIHPILNMAGVVNTMPAVLRQMTRAPGESVEAFRARVGSIAQIYELGDGATIGVLDMTKLVGRVIRNAFRRPHEFVADLNRARDKAYVSQSVAEFQETLSLFEGSGSKAAEIGRKVDKVLGFVTDKSEDLSRMWAHMTGIEVAKLHGITNPTDVQLFAHEFANKTIANYDPFNRPEIFQTSIGSVTGLFQTYGLNYLERLFRFIEVGDLRGAAVQIGFQAGLFGLASVPGYQAYSAALRFFSDERRSANDVFTSRFDQNVSDVLLHGTLSSIPKMFGSQGLDLSGRGSADPKLPGSVLTPSNLPIGNLAQRLFTAISVGIDQFRDGHPGIDIQQVAETMAKATLNRPLAGIIDQFFGEGRTDANGALVSEKVKNALDVAFVSLGGRTLQQTRDAAAFLQTARRTAEINDARARLRASIRSKAKRGKISVDDVANIIREYVRTGGDPKNFRTFFLENLIAANVVKNQVELERLLDDVDRRTDAIRLLEAAAGT